MFRLWTTSVLAIALGGGAAGCGGAARGHALKTAGGSASRTLSSGGAIASAGVTDVAVAGRAVPVIVILDVYQITAPRGAVSRNDTFWKHVDEDAVDIATHDLLLKNGIRIGIGRDADWGWFKGLLGKYPSTTQTLNRPQPGKEGYLELTMKSGVPEQTLFGIDDHDNDWGRRFERCNDLLAISFVASAHSPGATIVKVCPKIVGMRRFFRVSILNNEETRIDPAYPQQLFDMRLEALVKLNDFLIVAPSRQASISTSLGATFLLSAGKTEPLENVLIIVPRAYQIQRPAGAASR